MGDEDLRFNPKVLDKSIIAVPLQRILEKEQDVSKPQPVIIDLNLEYPGGQEEAKKQIRKRIDQALAVKTPGEKREQGIVEAKTEASEQYVFARLEAAVIRELVRLDYGSSVRKKDDPGDTAGRSIHRIWPDFPVKAFINKSVSTVKADAAHASFAAWGNDIVWAVVDSGIEATHPHFVRHQNLKLTGSLKHRDFVSVGESKAEEDPFGHGTHVAGIIAGEVTPEDKKRIVAFTKRRNEDDQIVHDELELTTIAGMAPRCKLVSLKVLDENGDGEASNLIVALEHIQKVNGYGRRLRIHGVNLSVGYEFEPEWFACGQSPLCVEVNRLVRSGVVVVVAAGNTGYGWVQSQAKGSVSAGQDLTINDPGNADLAITVGSTHRDAPHIYGVSYFSSKGPTGDGRIKPDVVAPGEKIISCATGSLRDVVAQRPGEASVYVENSGTSMAAPHVSGVIAAFLSIRREFIGQPEKVKQIFTDTATDLKRDRNFQGSGVVDLMRAIQSV